MDTAALSIPRGNGKSWLAGYIVSRVLSPDDFLFRPGTESVLFSGSIEQCRIVFRFARATLEPLGGYRFLDSATRCAITHEPTNTRLRVAGSNSKTSFGLVGCPWAIFDEPGSAEVIGGQQLYDSITTAQGKPGSPLKALFIGTLAPSLGGWWHDLVNDGTGGSTYVQALIGDPDKWEQWPEIRRCNPLTAVSPEFRKKLLAERDEARRDTRLKARFLSYRLNCPSGDESTMLLSVDDFERVCSRPVAKREGLPFVGVDLGGGRAWSAAVGIWRSGRVEALAVAPGIPSLADQEKRDRVPKGTYQRLAQSGALRVAEGLRVQPPAQLVGAILSEWGEPGVIVSDRFRLAELQDCTNGIPLQPRVARWSEAAEDIRALRKLAKDGPLSCEDGSRLLLTASLSAALVKNDDQGNTRLSKRGANNEARDDVAAALTLSAGAFYRELSRPSKPNWRYGGLCE